VSVDEESGAESESSAEDASAPLWPLHEQLVKLQSYEPDEIVGLTRMGVGLSFSGAELQVAEIASILGDVRLDWPRLSTTRQGEITSYANRVVSTVDQMLAMDSSRINTDEPGTTNAQQVREHRDGLIRQLSDDLNWFQENVRPVCIMARTREQAEGIVRSMSAAISEPELVELRETFAELRDQAAEFERLRPVVEAQRELLGASGAAKLSEDFDEESKDHAKAWKFWLAWLIGSVVALLVGGALFVSKTRPPDDATNAQIASHIFTDLLVIGLALFVIRVFSVQFRAHRHGEVVARNKANALTTFNRLVAGQPDEIQAVIAAALAQAVFKVDEGIFSDSSSEQVTIVERVLSPGIDRVRGA
jgi:hypothetical protein